MSVELKLEDLIQIIDLMRLKEACKVFKSAYQKSINSKMATMQLDHASELYLALSRFAKIDYKHLIPKLKLISQCENRLHQCVHHLTKAINACQPPHVLLNEIEAYKAQYKALLKACEAYEVTYSNPFSKLNSSLAELISDKTRRERYVEAIETYRLDTADIILERHEQLQQMKEAVAVCVAIYEYNRYTSEADYVYFKSIYNKHIDPLIAQEKILEDAKDELVHARQLLNRDLKSRPGLIAKIRVFMNRPIDQIKVTKMHAMRYVKAAIKFKQARYQHLAHYRDFIVEFKSDRRIQVAFNQVEALIHRVERLLQSPYNLKLDEAHGYLREIRLRRSRLREFIDSFDELYHQSGPTQFTHDCIEALKPFESHDISVWQDDGTRTTLDASTVQAIHTVQMHQQTLLEEARDAEREVLALANQVQQALISSDITLADGLDVASAYEPMNQNDLTVSHSQSRPH